jgi:hypothetical protein
LHWPASVLFVIFAGQVSVGFSLSVTVTLNAQLALRPPPSVAVQITVFAPTAKLEPDGGTQVTVTEPGQLSVALAAYSTTVLHWPRSALLAMFAGQVMLGAWPSVTVTLKEQLALRPTASVAVQVTVVAPAAKVEPDGGTQLTGTEPGQLSVAVGVYVTTALHWPTSALLVMFAGQVMLGAWPSLTVTVNEQLALRPAASVAVQVTVVAPSAKLEPDGGTQLTGTWPGQLSVAVAVYSATALHCSGAAGILISCGQVMLGAWPSVTVTVNEQLALRPAKSVAVQVTVVAPAAKMEPDGGTQLTVTEPGQLSVAVGV